MKKYILILLVVGLIADLASAQTEGHKYKNDFVLVPTKDNEYVDILVEADIKVVDNDLYETLSPDKESAISFIDDVVCVVLSGILSNYTSEEIPLMLNDISKELLIKVEKNRYELKPSSRGMKVENIILTLK